MTCMRLQQMRRQVSSVLARTHGVIAFTWRHPANRGQRVRRVLAVIRFQLLARAFGRRAIAPVGDRSAVYAETGFYHSARAIYANPLDWQEMTVWRAALLPSSLFVDVGANVGLYTIWALDAGATVVSVEPNRLARARLVENLQLNGYEAEVLPVALGEAEGTLRLTMDLDNQNHLVLLPQPDTAGTEEVPVRTLDSLVGDRTVDGLKIDVEGAELLVLKGARKLLSEKRVKLIQLEWNEKSVELLGEDRASTAAFLATYGYALFRPDAEGNLLPIENFEFGADVFARAEPLRSLLEDSPQEDRVRP